MRRVVHPTFVGGRVNPFMDAVCLCPANGQQDPGITMKPGRNQIWRANPAPDVTCMPELDDDAARPLALLPAIRPGSAAGMRTQGKTGKNMPVAVK